MAMLHFYCQSLSADYLREVAEWAATCQNKCKTVMTKR